MPSPLTARDISLEETTRITVREENYNILRKICKKYGMRCYIWITIDSVSVYPEGREFENLRHSQALPISKVNLVNPDWEKIENSILTHSLSVTF